MAAGRLTRFWGYVSHDPKDHEKTNQKTKDLRPSFVSQLHHPLSQGSGQPPFLQQRLTAFYQVRPILSRNLPCPTRTENEDRVLTHILTHEQKKRGGNSGTKRIHGRGNPAAKPPKSSETVWKTALSNLHTHEATGSSPVVSTKNHRNRLIPVIFFHNPQLFMALNFCRFSKTHNLTHTGKGPESTGQGQTGNFLSGPVFFAVLTASAG